MPNEYFKFKQFTIYQNRCAMKVGTDGVLLGVLAPIINSGKILDIGTGTGLVAIMMAQRCPNATEIFGIEIDKDAAIQAQENANKTEWPIRIINKSIQEFSSYCDEKFNLIVSNPPYFIDSLKAPKKNRNIARHTDELSFQDLVISVHKLLAVTGKFTVIIPYSSEDNFINIANKENLFAEDIIHIIPKVGKEIKRSVITFSKNISNKGCDINVTELIIETEERHKYSEEFKKLTADFYLKH